MPAMGLKLKKNTLPLTLSKKLTTQNLPLLINPDTVINPIPTQKQIMENIITITTLPSSSSSTKPTPKTTISASESESDISDLFHQPKRPLRLPQSPAHQTSTQLSNRFKPLETSMDTSEPDARPLEGQVIPPKNSPRLRAPAPVIIAGKVNDHAALVALINKNVGKGFQIKYTKNNANVYFDHKADKDKFVTLIKNKNIQYHTYTDSTEKTHAFVIRGLDNAPSTEELQTELQRHNINIHKIYRMTTQHRPLYLAVTDASETLTNIQQKVKCLFHTRITWERHINKKILTQCHRCQSWGHATSNCNRNPRCVKCAGEHLTITCSKTRDTPAKCANCSQDHPANSTTCPAYIRKLEEAARNNPNMAVKLRYESVANPQPHYIPAPIPKTNPWNTRYQNPPKPNDFPSLPTPSSTIPHYNQHQQLPKQPLMGDNPSSIPPCPPQTLRAPASAQPPTTNIGQTKTIITDLCSELNALNSLINLKNLLKFVKDMNSELRTAADQQSRAFIAIEFMSNMSSYNI